MIALALIFLCTIGGCSAADSTPASVVSIKGTLHAIPVKIAQCSERLKREYAPEVFPSPLKQSPDDSIEEDFESFLIEKVRQEEIPPDEQQAIKALLYCVEQDLPALIRICDENKELTAALGLLWQHIHKKSQIPLDERIGVLFYLLSALEIDPENTYRKVGAALFADYHIINTIWPDNDKPMEDQILLQALAALLHHKWLFLTPTAAALAHPLMRKLIWHHEAAPENITLLEALRNSKNAVALYLLTKELVGTNNDASVALKQLQDFIALCDSAHHSPDGITSALKKNLTISKQWSPRFLSKAIKLLPRPYQEFFVQIAAHAIKRAPGSFRGLVRIEDEEYLTAFDCFLQLCHNSKFDPGIIMRACSSDPEKRCLHLSNDALLFIASLLSKLTDNAMTRYHELCAVAAACGFVNKTIALVDNTKHKQLPAALEPYALLINAYYTNLTGNFLMRPTTEQQQQLFAAIAATCGDKLIAANYAQLSTDSLHLGTPFNDRGTTLLMRAAQINARGVVLVLLAQRTPVMQRDHEQCTALDYALRNGHYKCAGKLASSCRQHLTDGHEQRQCAYDAILNELRKLEVAISDHDAATFNELVRIERERQRLLEEPSPVIHPSSRDSRATYFLQVRSEERAEIFAQVTALAETMSEFVALEQPRPNKDSRIKILLRTAPNERIEVIYYSPNPFYPLIETALRSKVLRLIEGLGDICKQSPFLLRAAQHNYTNILQRFLNRNFISDTEYSQAIKAAFAHGAFDCFALLIQRGFSVLRRDDRQNVYDFLFSMVKALDRFDTETEVQFAQLMQQNPSQEVFNRWNNARSTLRCTRFVDPLQAIAPVIQRIPACDWSEQQKRINFLNQLDRNLNRY